MTRTPGDGIHFVTDELLAEGKNRQYLRLDVYRRENPNKDVLNGHLAEYWGNLRLSDRTFWAGPLPFTESLPEAHRMRKMGADGKLSDYKGFDDTGPWMTADEGVHRWHVEEYSKPPKTQDSRKDHGLSFKIPSLPATAHFGIPSSPYYNYPPRLNLGKRGD
jgi:hypothetical protein